MRWDPGGQPFPGLLVALALTLLHCKDVTHSICQNASSRPWRSWGEGAVGPLMSLTSINHQPQN